MVSNVLSDTYASGLTAQFGNFAGDKGFGFNLNTSGGYELYVKNTTWNKALTIANTGAATFSSSVTAGGIIYGTNGITDPTAGTNAGTTLAYNGNSPNNNYSTGLAGIRNSAYDIFFQTGAANGGGYRWYIGTSEKMTMSSTGNVGIGTTAPKLNGNAGTFVTIDGGSSSSAWLELATSSTTDGLGGAITFNNNNIAGADKRNAQISGIRDGANNSGALNFLTWNAGSASERMRITSGGYTKMTTDGTYWNASGYHEMRQTVTNNLITLFTNSSASPYGINLYFTAASPNNTTNYFLTGGDNTNDKFFIYSNGSMVNRTGTYGTISDVKYKENIVDATSKLEDISKLKVRNFNFKGDSTKQLGFIAQEFEEVFPNMIDISKESGESGETYKAIKTSVLVPMLVKAIQELKAELDTLKNK
jgi:hypothetical protein